MKFSHLGDEEDSEILQKMYGVTSWKKNATYLGIQDKDTEVIIHKPSPKFLNFHNFATTLIPSLESSCPQKNHRLEQHQERNSQSINQAPKGW